MWRRRQRLDGSVHRTQRNDCRNVLRCRILFSRWDVPPSEGNNGGNWIGSGRRKNNCVCIVHRRLFLCVCVGVSSDGSLGRPLSQIRNFPSLVPRWFSRTQFPSFRSEMCIVILGSRPLFFDRKNSRIFPAVSGAEPHFVFTENLI